MSIVVGIGGLDFFNQTIQRLDLCKELLINVELFFGDQRCINQVIDPQITTLLLVGHRYCSSFFIGNDADIFWKALIKKKDELMK